MRTPQVDEKSWCNDRYSKCDADTSGVSCRAGSLFEYGSGWRPSYGDGICYKENPSDPTTKWSPPPRGPHTNQHTRM